MTRLRARIVFLLLGVVLVWGLLPGSRAGPQRTPPPGRGDAALYSIVISRIAAGDGYYQALGDELRRDSYPTASVLNWRTPLHLSFVAVVGPPAAAVLLKVLALAAVLATAAVLARLGAPALVVGTLAQMGALATAFQPAAEGVAEIWAGVLLAHALCAYHQRWWTAGASLGAAAIFIRELAGPFGASCGLMALSRRRAREAMVWVAAGVVYVAYFVYHVIQVQAHRLPGDLVHEHSWIQPNGIRFLLATAGVNGWLQFLPQGITAVLVPVALAGAASARMPDQARAALLLYAALFTVIGLPFNYYWGFVTAPLWAFGLAYAPDGLARLWRAAGEPQPQEPLP